MNSKLFICVVIIIGINIIPLDALEVAVDAVNGNDNSINGPFKTLQKALSKSPNSVWISSNGIVELGSTIVQSLSSIRIYANGTSKAQLRCPTAEQVSFWFSNIGSLTFENLIFGDCNTTYGALHFSSINNLVFSSCTIENFVVDGGATITAQGSAINITNTTIRNNFGLLVGAGIYVDNCTLSISYSNITQNTCSDDGAGLYFTTGSSRPISLSILHTEFSHNQAGDNGGAMYVSGMNAPITVNLYKVYVYNNTANAVGAGIVLLDVAATVDNCQFESNTIAASVGGAVFAQYNTRTDQILQFTNSEFFYNWAEGGSSICLDNSAKIPIQFPSVIQNCSMHNNHANSYGAGISTFYFPAKIQNSKIKDNAAYIGAGIRMANSVVEILQTTITGNSNYGIGCFDSNVTIDEPSFFGNNPLDSNDCGTCNWDSSVFDCSAGCTDRDQCSVCGGTNDCLGCNDVPYAGECPSPSPTPTTTPTLSKTPSPIPAEDSSEYSKESSKSNSAVIAGAVGGAGGLLVFGSAIGVLVARSKRRKSKKIEETELKTSENQPPTPSVTGGQVSTNYSMVLSQSPSQSLSTIGSSQSQSTAYGSIIDELRLPDQTGVQNLLLEDIVEEGELGRGSFGVVFRGLYKDEVVAVKKLLGSLNRTQLNTFAAEAAIMASIPKHKHVVELIGMVPLPPCIIVKYYPNGSLQKLLRGSEMVMSKQMIVKIIRGISEGMAHLAQHKVVHRDLAARNILLDENWEAVVSDFGFARALQEDEDTGQTYTTVGPIRWMSLESLTSRTYSEKSDVWSWAVTVWECLTRDVPFGGLDNVNVIMKVTAGERLPIPTRCSPSLASLMGSCWEADPNNRPTFAEILQVVVNEGENILSE